jgi:hypothetical protein
VVGRQIHCQGEWVAGTAFLLCTYALDSPKGGCQAHTGETHCLDGVIGEGLRSTHIGRLQADPLVCGGYYSVGWRWGLHVSTAVFAREVWASDHLKLGLGIRDHGLSAEALSPSAQFFSLKRDLLAGLILSPLLQSDSLRDTNEAIC